LPTLATPPRVGTQNAGEPKANGGGQMGGSRGAMPPWRGAWGVSPHENLKGASYQPLQPAHEWDPKRWRILSQRGWGRGVEGAQPLPRGFGGCAPKIKKRGRVAHINLKGASYQPLQPAHEWDPKRWRILSQRGWGRGVEGAQPLPRGFGGCAPKIKKRGRVAHISNPATSGTQNAGKP
jgi:hypothetical protein